MKLSPEHQKNEEGILPKGIRLIMGCWEEDSFRWSRGKSGIIQNFLWDVLGKGHRKGKKEIKTDWINL